jgi:hypothetical protein
MIKAHHPKTRAERRKLHVQKDIKFEIKETSQGSGTADYEERTEFATEAKEDDQRNLELDNQPHDHR